MSLMEISKSIPQNLDYSERKQILPKKDTQKSGNSQKMIPKNPGIAQKGTQKSGSNPQKGTQKSGSNPQKLPKIMAHPVSRHIQVTPWIKYQIISQKSRTFRFGRAFFLALNVTSNSLIGQQKKDIASLHWTNTYDIKCKPDKKLVNNITL